MFKLDNDFLISLGLGGLPVDEKNKLLQVIYERLEMNVGMRLAERMTDAQLDEFEGFIDRNDETGALHWLETNFPNYKDVVAEELEKLKKEVGASVPQILAAAQQQPNQAMQSVPNPPMPPQQQSIAEPFSAGQQPYGGQPAVQQQASPQSFEQPIPQQAPAQPYVPPTQPPAGFPPQQ